MNLTMNELETTRHYLRDKPVFQACTFGPCARGEADAQSDLDLLLELDYSQPIGWQFVGMKLDLEAQLKKSVDLVSENGLSPRLRPFIEQDKQLVNEQTVR